MFVIFGKPISVSGNMYTFKFVSGWTFRQTILGRLYINQTSI